MTKVLNAIKLDPFPKTSSWSCFETVTMVTGNVWFVVRITQSIKTVRNKERERNVVIYSVHEVQ